MSLTVAPAVERRNSMLDGEPQGAADQPFPVRKGCRVQPLIEAADMFPALERLVLHARRSMWMAFRIFDPRTAVHSEEALAAGARTWVDLLRIKARDGVSVRLFLADFEPVLADHLHAGSWASFRALRELADELGEGGAANLQVMVVQHDGEIGAGWRQLLRPLVSRRVRRTVEEMVSARDAEDGGMRTRPGLWRYCRWDGDDAAGWQAGAPPRLWPATYHQKFAVADEEVAILGGIDVDERRWDNRRHRQRADQTWHDISARLEGPAAGDVAEHFRRLWNGEMPRYRRIVDEWTHGAGRRLLLDPLSEIGPARPLPPAAGEADVQIVRTSSRPRHGPFAVGPRPHVRELKAAHRALIMAAERRLYIEAQFFRSREAGQWVLTALRRNPALEIVILVANTPEEIAFEGQGDNPAHKHGEYLQASILGKLRREGGKRLGLFTLVKQERVRGDERTFEGSRGTAFGAGVIHIHSKLLIADDAHALLSSANINGRSFDWDAELGLLWREGGETIAAFRRRLWAQLWDGSLPPNATLGEWREGALTNAGVAPEARRGFVVPYQLGRARRYGRPSWFVPDDLV